VKSTGRDGLRRPPLRGGVWVLMWRRGMRVSALPQGCAGSTDCFYSKNLECTWNSCGSKSVLARVQLRGVSVPCLVVRCGELGNGRPSQRARAPPTRSNIPSRDSLAAIGGRYGSTIRNVGASI